MTMWILRGVLCVSVVWGLALDSNTIRSSKEQDGSHGDQLQRPARRRTETNSHRRGSTTETSQRGGCSNRAQRKGSAQDRQTDRQNDRQNDRQTDRQNDRQTDTHINTDGFNNRTKAMEMGSCVRSGDCGIGLCCVRYLTVKRCQRIPRHGDACLLRGANKKRSRKLGRCDCEAGLTCKPVTMATAALGGASSSKVKGQGVCLPTTARHAGNKKRRTAETSC